MTEISEADPIALFDMDNTLVDYNKVMQARLASMRSPLEPDDQTISGREPDHVWERRKSVQRDPEFWKHLPLYQPGYDLWQVAGTLGFIRHILTQGPVEMPHAWAGKVESVQKHFGVHVPITITREKGGYYGRILVDDWPPYCLAWLKHRPRGLVVMPAHPWNADINHPQVIRYDGTNIEEVKARMRCARDRKSGEPL